MPQNNGNTLSQLIIGFIKLNERQQIVGTFLAIILFLGYNNRKDSEEKQLLNKQALDRTNQINLMLIQDNRELKKELNRVYDINHDIVVQKVNKTDSIIQSKKK